VDPNQCPVNFNLCDKDESVEFLSLPDITNASGPDSIAAHMQKATACSIAPLMMKLFDIESRLYQKWNIAQYVEYAPVWYHTMDQV